MVKAPASSSSQPQPGELAPGAPAPLEPLGVSSAGAGPASEAGAATYRAEGAAGGAKYCGSGGGAGGGGGSGGGDPAGPASRRAGKFEYALEGVLVLEGGLVVSGAGFCPVVTDARTGWPAYLIATGVKLCAERTGAGAAT